MRKDVFPRRQLGPQGSVNENDNQFQIHLDPVPRGVTFMTARRAAMKSGEARRDSRFGSGIENDTHIHYQCAPHCPEPVAADDLLRCLCGALLARWVRAGLELKCRRCKRTTLIPYPSRTAVTGPRPT
jgi:hypothetical protein